MRESSANRNPASRLTVRSRGSYWSRRFMDAVEMVTSAGAGAPPRQSFEKLPPRRIVRCASAASPSSAASSSGCSGRSMLGGGTYQHFDLIPGERAMFADLEAGDFDGADLGADQFQHG